MRPLSLRERRLVAVLILVAVVALVFRLVIAPLTNGFAERAARKRDLALQYEHNVRVIATVPRLTRAAERMRADVRPFTLAADDVQGARDLLKERLQQTVERAGGEFRSAADVEADPSWVRAGATARLTLPQLTAVLAALQNTPPWLVIDTLTIGADDALVTGRASNMDVQLEASIPLRTPAAR